MRVAGIRGLPQHLARCHPDGVNRPFACCCVVVAVAALAAAPDAGLAQKVKKTYGLHPQSVRHTNALVSREASTVAQKNAEARILEGGVYSIGALSIVVNEAAEGDVFAVLKGDEGELRDERTAAATRLFVAVLKRFPQLQNKVLASDFPRDRLIVLASADEPETRAVVESLEMRPLPAHYLPVVNWIAVHRRVPLEGAQRFVDAGSR